MMAAAAAWSTQVVFDADNPQAADALQLADTPQAPCIRATVQNLSVVSVPVNDKDYYQRMGVSLRVPEGFVTDAPDLYLIVEHLDTGLGLMQVFFTSNSQAKTRAAASPLAGYTCLGTGIPRRALFRLDQPRFGADPDHAPDVTIEGAAAVRRVILKTALEDGEAESIRAEIPDQPPAKLKLAHPMQWVLQVGADAATLDGLPGALDTMRELCPLAAALGFTGVESYVKWNFIEREKGVYDWSFYDAIAAEARKHGLKWFPLLIVGSAYALPSWYHDSPENVGFVCLEHRQGNNIQSIFCENQTPYVRAFLDAFGEHYEPTGDLLGVRLGPSGNFGESQYPAGGNWGYLNKREHIHIGWWAGDVHASTHFQHWLHQRYPSIEALNGAWDTQYLQWGEVGCFVPQFAEMPRQRKDFIDWYMGAMTDWCERWAVWAREAMPNTVIYQSAGGWGFVESGTDFTDQTKSMVKVKGGIRATNETDSYAQNFQVTRMMSSAARFYGVPFGSEPAGFNSAKGVVSRVYNLLVNNGQHLFFYNGNLLGNDQGIPAWLDVAPLLDQRAEPVIDVAVLYPDTLSKLDDGVFRNLYASSFYQRIAPLRAHLDFDYCGERMVLDGALSRYKVLVLAWNNTVEADVLDAIDRWVRDGGTLLIMHWDRTPLQTVENDASLGRRWQAGDTGQGRVEFITEDREPPHRFADRVKRDLLAMDGLHPLTKAMLHVEKPSEVYVSALTTGMLAVLNYNDAPASVSLPGQEPVTLAPYRIALIPAE
jgi:hypothetical protein